MAEKGKVWPTRVIIMTGVLSTLAIAPWFTFDPINLPKMFFLSLGAGILLGWIFSISKYKEFSSQPAVFLSVIFCSILIFAFIRNEAPKNQQFWGVWGRSTGLLTYLSLMILLVASIVIANEQSLRVVRVAFERLGYAITLYTFLQLLDLDPINWSQKLMVATLGNINFMSSFLGMTSISYICRTMIERHSTSAKLHYLFLLICNVFLVLKSGSIQGIAVLLAGTSLLIGFKLYRDKKYLQFYLFFCTSLTLGSLLFLGTIGTGPLSSLRQETVIFRLDYWKAAVEMIRYNVVSGIGIDSYGDFYREYRSNEAVIRTGPQRVSNTAHNIFLDITSGAGVFAGAIFLIIVGATFVSILRTLKAINNVSDFVALSGIWLGFQVFCLISINQIGVGVWGFILTGLINGYARLNEKSKSCESTYLADDERKKISSLSERNFKALKSGQIFACIFGLIFAVSAFIPNMADAKFLSAIKGGNLEAARSITEGPGIQDFHHEKLIEALKNQGLDKVAVDQAKLLVLRNPRNWFGWVTILTSQTSTLTERKLAGQKLRLLDPKNQSIIPDIERLLKP